MFFNLNHKRLHEIICTKVANKREKKDLSGLMDHIWSLKFNSIILFYKAFKYLKIFIIALFNETDYDISLLSINSSVIFECVPENIKIPLPRDFAQRFRLSHYSTGFIPSFTLWLEMSTLLVVEGAVGM